jgi:hypothetical protein
MKNVLALGAAAVIAGLPVAAAITGGSSDAAPDNPVRTILPEQSSVGTPLDAEPVETAQPATPTTTAAPPPLPPPMPVPGSGGDDDDHDRDDDDDDDDDRDDDDEDD